MKRIAKLPPQEYQYVQDSKPQSTTCCKLVDYWSHTHSIQSNESAERPYEFDDTVSTPQASL